MGKQVSQYDKIIKENIEAVIPSLMQNVLGIIAVESEEIPDDIQHTKERKPDVLKKVTDNQGDTYILQIEFQVADEPKMVYRMAEYYIMLEHKYEILVRQFIIFLGSFTPQMPTRLDRPNLTFTFPIISLSGLDYRIFLHSDRPEEVILSILADFKGADLETALQRIIRRIDETTGGDFAFKRHFNQLRVLAQLRNLGIKLKEAMDSIVPFINEERDVLYLRGFDKGETKGETKAQIRVIRNLLTKMSLTVEQIADIAGVSVEFVKQVQQK